MKIADVIIGNDNAPAIIAELSGNHNQSLDRTLRLVEEAHKAGVHLIKLQTYTPDTITLNSNHPEFTISDTQSLWHGRSLYSLYEEAHMPWEWQEEIINYSQELGMPCFSSVFDETSLEFLERLNLVAYKIASQEIVHLPLIREVAMTGKPIILSTGMASLSEIDSAVNMICKTGDSDYALLKCSSSYPAPPLHCNLLTIPRMKDVFGCEIGLSDHTLGIGVALGAIALGANVIEKHMTLDRQDGGVDSGFSSEPSEIKQLVEESRAVKSAMGCVHFGPTAADISSMTGRRSIYVCKDIKTGEKLDHQNIKIVRPNKGLSPKFFDIVLGMTAKYDLQQGTALKWDDIG